VIRHPHVPDPDHPDYETVIHSVYGHLSSQLVKEGDVVQKGQEIALSGKTGFATGPHLHFQIDKDTAPWHPYWAFSATEAAAAGLNTTTAIDAGLDQARGYQYTYNPMLLVQANYAPAKNKFAYNGSSSTTSRGSVAVKPTTPAKTMAQITAQRRADRLAKLGTAVAVAPVASSKSSVATSAAPIVQTQTVADTSPKPTPSAPVLVVPQSGEVATIEISVDSQFQGREWQTVRLTLLDKDGNVASENKLTKDLYMRTAYGEADFNPPELSALDFKNGSATVKMLARGTRTVVIDIEPYKVMSKPIKYIGK
jgi:hypothetical protein